MSEPPTPERIRLISSQVADLVSDAVRSVEDFDGEILDRAWSAAVMLHEASRLRRELLPHHERDEVMAALIPMAIEREEDRLRAILRGQLASEYVPRVEHERMRDDAARAARGVLAAVFPRR